MEMSPARVPAVLAAILMLLISLSDPHAQSLDRTLLKAGTEPQTSPQRHDRAEARRLIQQAEQEAAKIPKKEPRVTALEDVAVAKARAGDYEGALLIAQALGTNESKAKILEQMAVQKIRDGDYDAIVKIVEGIAAVDDKISAYADIVETLVFLKQEGVALTLMEHAQRIKLPDNDNGLLDQITIGRTLAIAGNPEKTLAMASALKAGTPLQNDVKAILFVIGNAYHHDIPGALGKLAESHTDSIQVMGLEAIAEAQFKAGDKLGAAATCKQILKSIQTAKVSPAGRMMTLAHMQSLNGDPVGARTTIQAAQDAAVKKSDEAELADMAMQQAEIGDVDGALKTMARIKKASNQVAARQAIAAFRAKSGDVTAALAMSPPGADAFCKAEVLVGTAQGILESLNPFPKP